MVKYIKILADLFKKDIKIAGGKGASLGEMIQNKIPVPQGFIILASAFDRFMEKTDLNVEIEALLHKVNFKKVNSADRISNKIRDLISDVEFPKDIAKEIKKSFEKLGAKYVAVRSSATAEDSKNAAWAGQLESYLNTTEKKLLENVKKCWASIYTPRAIFYRFDKKLNGAKISVAVVVQKMIQSEISGICFTVHPVTKDYNQMIIEAGYGFGEAIVGGKITPDAYIVNKNSKIEILDKNISEQTMMIVGDRHGIKEISVLKSNQNKQKLSDKQILELSKICVNIEKHYKKPQDIEWVFEKGKFYIVQSRPITTL